MKFQQQRLDNGLNVIAECNAQAYSTSVAFFVRTGSRDETPEIAGVSHFLEHMVFKGTPRRSAADVNRELDELGSHSNAFTSEEQTVYYATVLPEYQNEVIDLLSDIMRPSLREEDFNMEKQVIIEEILKYEDQPPFGAHEKCMEAYFGTHPLAKNVLGTVDSVGNMTPEGMRAYFQKRYSPGNMTLAAAGNVDFDAFVAKAEAHCGKWDSFEANRDTPPTAGVAGKQSISKESATQAYSVLISSGPSATDPQRFAARLLSNVLGDDSGSRMYWSLVDPGLAEYAGAATYEFDGTGILMSYLCCDPKDTEANLQSITAIQQTLDAEGVTADELELVKSKVCSQIVRRSERPSSRLFSVGNSWLQRHDYRSIRETIDAYQAVTRDDLMSVLSEHPLSKTMAVSVGPS
jgi:predicted Zn-dependent peptidase